MSEEPITKADDPLQGASDDYTETHQGTTEPADPSPQPADPSPQLEPAQQQTTQAPDHEKHGKKKKKKQKLRKQGPLHSLPLGNYPKEIKLARIRAAIAAGADVNGLDESDPVGHRDGRPLDACLRVTHMCAYATFTSNLNVIKVLLEHGADPRLRDRNSAFFTPLEVAIFNAEKEGQTEKWKDWYGQVVVLFKEAIAKLEEKEKGEKREEEKEGGQAKEREEQKSTSSEGQHL